MVKVGEIDMPDYPYRAICTVETPQGHIDVTIDEHGHFIVILHSTGSDKMLPIVGTLDKDVGNLIHTIDNEHMNFEDDEETPKPRLH